MERPTNIFGAELWSLWQQVLELRWKDLQDGTFAFETVDVPWQTWWHSPWLLGRVLFIKSVWQRCILPLNSLGFDTWNFCLLKLQERCWVPLVPFWIETSFDLKCHNKTTQPLAARTMHCLGIQEWEAPSGISHCLMSCSIRSANPGGSWQLCPWPLSRVQENGPDSSSQSQEHWCSRACTEFYSPWERHSLVHRFRLQRSKGYIIKIKRTWRCLLRHTNNSKSKT